MWGFTKLGVLFSGVPLLTYIKDASILGSILGSSTCALVLGAPKTRGRILMRTQKRTMILTTYHMCPPCRILGFRGWSTGFRV